ncbi:RNA polymerase sigma factor SigB [compost metagenome]
MESFYVINERVNNLVKSVQMTQDKEKSKKIIEQILAQLNPYRRSLATKFSGIGVEFDDIVQQIDLKIIEAIYDYDETKDSSAFRHLTSRAKNGIWNYYRKEMNYFNKDKKTISLDGLEYYDSCETLLGTNFRYDLNEDQIIDRIIIEEELEKITDHQREVILMFYMDDKNTYDIADELQINQSNVSRAKNRGVKSIQENINSEDDSL